MTIFRPLYFLGTKILNRFRACELLNITEDVLKNWLQVSRCVHVFLRKGSFMVQLYFSLHHTHNSHLSYSMVQHMVRALSTQCSLVVNVKPWNKKTWIESGSRTENKIQTIYEFLLFLTPWYDLLRTVKYVNSILSSQYSLWQCHSPHGITDWY